MTFVDLFSGKEKLQHSGDAEISLNGDIFERIKIKKKILLKRTSTQSGQNYSYGQKIF